MVNRPERTLLIVDDSPEDRELYRRYLLLDHDRSYAILEAELGERGLELWHQHQPDAVLLDLRLPDMDGLELIDQLYGAMPDAGLPMVMVTGQGNEAIVVRAIKAGAQDYLATIKRHAKSPLWSPSQRTYWSAISGCPMSMAILRSNKFGLYRRKKGGKFQRSP